jgi:hypothetical protein
MQIVDSRLNDTIPAAVERLTGVEGRVSEARQAAIRTSPRLDVAFITGTEISTG